MRAISLFSGAGGMDVGFESAGVDVAWANEIDADASKTYRHNHSNVLLRECDIKVARKEFKTLRGQVDLVFGGPPCQGFSVAGKMNPDDERSKLIWEFFDVVVNARPSAFVMENVKALGKLGRWKAIRDKITSTASKMGYSCFYRVLNSADYGVPQKRERVFFIGFRDFDGDTGKLFDEEIYSQRKQRVNLRDCLKSLPSAGTRDNPKTCTAKISLASSPVLRKSQFAGMLFNGLGRPLNLDNQANTLPASMGGNKTPILDELLLDDPSAEDWIADYHHALMTGNACADKDKMIVPPHIRRITILEAAAIQTFPRHYQFFGEKSSIYRQIGNAVPCLLAEAVARATVAVYQKLNMPNAINS
jgi:DNA (cytosine-5)-methyltransferase 1